MPSTCSISSARKRLAARRLTVVDARTYGPRTASDSSGLPASTTRWPWPSSSTFRRSCAGSATRHVRTASSARTWVRSQIRTLRRHARRLGREGFRYTFRFSSEEEVAAVEIERQRLWTDRRDERGPFDIVGDVHGCFDELGALLHDLGYDVVRTNDGADGDRFRVSHPEGRRLVFLGDLVDRGPKIAECLRLAMDAVAGGAALCVPGNREVKLLKKLRGRDVKTSHGLAETIEQLEAEPPEFRARTDRFIGGLINHIVLDDAARLQESVRACNEVRPESRSVASAYSLCHLSHKPQDIAAFCS